MTFHVPNKYRIRAGHLGSDDSAGNYGAFSIPVCARSNKKFFIIAAEGSGWEHVSVSLRDRLPSWEEMCFIKSLFWDSDDCVVQYHPAATYYVNYHAYCLHLWRPTQDVLPVPPTWMIGPRPDGGETCATVTPLSKPA